MQQETQADEKVVEGTDDPPPGTPVIDMVRTVAEANATHAHIQNTGRMLVEDAIAIGKFLLDQKFKVKHGGWQAWMKKNLEFNERTAQRYMMLYERRHEIGWGDILGIEDENRQGVSDLKQAEAIGALLDNPTPIAVPAPKNTPAPKSITQAHKQLSKPKPAKRKVIAKQPTKPVNDDPLYPDVEPRLEEFYYICGGGENGDEAPYSIAFDSDGDENGGHSGCTFWDFPTEEAAQEIADELNANVQEILKKSWVHG